MKKRLVVGNWKMYVGDGTAARSLLLALKRHEKNFKPVEIWITPPFPYISYAASLIGTSAIRIGAQSVSPFPEGAHTGEVSAAMLKNCGAAFTIIGHSEQRSRGMNNEDVHAALQQGTRSGLRAVLCIGEESRDEQGGHFEFLSDQLRTALRDIPQAAAGRVTIAYEPLWAIGKSAHEAAKPEIVRETSIYIRKTLAQLFDRSAALKVPILYGGSVEGENAAALLERGGIDGFLVGRASSDAKKLLDILTICRAVPNGI